MFRNGDPAEFTDPDEFGPGRGLRNDIAFGMGIQLLFGRAALARDEAAVSPNASWTVFRDQARSELLLRAALLISFPVLPELWPPHF